jgi:DNA-binding SARP family transcriptional activator
VNIQVPDNPALRVRLLGGYQFLYNGSPVTSIYSTRLRDLIACLILRRLLPQSRSELAFQFWPDSSEEQARANLRNLLHGLRQAFPQIDTYLNCDGQYLQWGNTPFGLDLSDFEIAILRAAHAEADSRPQEACLALEEAVGHYQGDLLPNCYEDWILPERERLSQVYLNALERLATLWEQQRNYAKAIQYAQMLLRYDSLRESTYRALIRLYALNKDRAGVMRTYRACVQVLRRDL